MSDQSAPQEVERLYCTACGYGLKPGTPDGGHNPNCPWLADARRDGTEGRQ